MYFKTLLNKEAFQREYGVDAGGNDELINEMFDDYVRKNLATKIQSLPPMDLSDEIDVPLEDFGVTLDKDQWFSHIGKNFAVNSLLGQSRDIVVMGQLSPNGYMLSPVAHLNGKVLLAKSKKFVTIDEFETFINGAEWYLYYVSTRVLDNIGTFDVANVQIIRYATVEK